MGVLALAGSWLREHASAGGWTGLFGGSTTVELCGACRRVIHGHSWRSVRARASTRDPTPAAPRGCE